MTSVVALRKSVTFSLLLSFSLVGYGQAQSAPANAAKQATEAYRAGTEAYQKGDFAAATRSFQRAVRLAPGISVAHHALGLALLKSGNVPGAVRELDVTVRLAPVDPAAVLDLAVAYSIDRKYPASVKMLRRSRELDPRLEGLDAVSAVALAVALTQTGDEPHAEALLQQVSAAVPDDSGITDALGTCQARRRAYAQATATFQRAIALDDSLAAAHFHLGAVYVETAHLEAATVELLRARELDPRNTSYAIKLATAYLAAGSGTAATETLKDALKTANNEADRLELRYQLAVTLQATDHPTEALALYDALIKARPDDAEALTNTGLAHVQTGDAAGGIALYLRAIKLQPANPTLREDLGVAYLQQSDLNHALEQFRSGLALDSDSPQLHYDLALALKLQDNLGEAIPEFQRAAALDPSLPDPPYTLGIIYMQQGKFAEAAESLEKAIALQPANGEALAELGSVYRELGQPQKAEVVLRRAIEVAPNQPGAHITLASVLAAQSRKDEAAAERKSGAELTRIAVNRQKADFALKSGTALLRAGKTNDALVQMQNAVEADPVYAAAYTGLSEALERAGRKAEASEQRRRAQELVNTANAKP